MSRVDQIRQMRKILEHNWARKETPWSHNVSTQEGTVVPIQMFKCNLKYEWKLTWIVFISAGLTGLARNRTRTSPDLRLNFVSSRFSWITSVGIPNLSNSSRSVLTELNLRARVKITPRGRRKALRPFILKQNQDSRFILRIWTGSEDS